MYKLYGTNGPINTTEIFHKTQNTIYPENSKYPKCTAMLLNNLVNPEWITIDCDEPLTSDIMCHFPRQLKQPFNWATDRMEIYNSSCVHKNDTCFIFLWGLPDLNFRSISKKILRKQIHHINIFQYLFNSVSASFPPILLTGMGNTMSYIRYGNIFNYKIMEPNKTKEILQIFTQPQLDPRNGGNIFKCKRYLISIDYLCDGKVDCESNERLDEINCYCAETEVYLSKCKYITSEEGPKYCSDFYIKTIHNNCWPFAKLICLNGKVKEENTDFCERFKPRGTKSVSNSQTSMSINDNLLCNCSVKINNESNIWNVLSDRRVNCAIQGLLFCTSEHSECYPISEICNYLLDKCDCLVTCRGGEHLQNCKDAVCSMKFKCPLYYCVPWSYICDGKWDCPNGLEEQNCDQKRECKNMFKCKNSVICIHPNSICDDKFDCPANEDELYCNLDKIICPSICQCLMFAIRCLKVSTSGINLKDNHPYHVIIIMKSTKLFVNTLLKFSRFVTVLKLSMNSLNVLCPILPCTDRTQLIDAGYNKIQRVNARCFQQAYYLKAVKLNNNVIFRIYNRAFEKLDELIIIDLSYNMLTTLSVHIFNQIPNLQLLRLRENNLIFVDYDAFYELNVHILESTANTMTCISSLKTKFIIRKPWFVFCTHLLKKEGIRICCFCIFILLISLNMISLTEHMAFYKNSRQDEAFAFNILSLNVIDTSYGLYILYLFAVDIYYREDFGFYQNQWRSSAMCFVGFTLAFNFSLVSPILVCFIALVRLLVVLFPMHTTFKKTEFVRKCIFVITVTCFVVAISITSIMKSVYKEIPLGLCSPFVDPTKSNLLLTIISFLVIIYQFVAVIFVSVVHCMILMIVQKSKKAVSRKITKKQTNISIFIQLTIMTLACLLSWIPSGLVYLSTWFLDKYSIDTIIWTAIVVTPIELIVHSLVFIITSLRTPKGSHSVKFPA